ncbi:MAG: TatD family hydrolase [Candidatus Heimdallarchaeota archaeon]|nr:MAG: TatD family hydrolase [Candidatus Heimdallarchaeota archaeon]
MTKPDFYIDVHSHLPDNYFFKDINTYIMQWRHQGLMHVVSVSQNYTESLRSIELSNIYAEIIPAIGIHPWKAHKKHDELQDFNQLLSENKEIKILGEIGLDYHFIKRKERYSFQKKVLDFFFIQAEKRDLRLMLHVKGAEAEIADYIETSTLPGKNCCIHWYSGPTQILKKLIDLDCYFSCGPALSYSKHQKVPKRVPLDRLLTESDGNVKYQGRVGHPGMMSEVVDLIANITNQNRNELQQLIIHNSLSYLGKK